MLTLAFISDLHFGKETWFRGKLRKLTRDGPALTKAFVERMNTAVKPDAIVNLGDDIEDEDLAADRDRYTACVRLLQRADAPVFHVAGNHDTVNLSRDEMIAIWGDGPWIQARSKPDLAYAFDLRGHRLIVMETHETTNVEISVGDAQIAWLDAELRAATLPVILLLHHPISEQDLTDNHWFGGREHVALVKERAAIRGLLRQSGKVRVVVNGHVHWNHFDVVDGIPHVTVQSLIENLDDDGGRRPAAAHAIVRVTDRRVLVDLCGAERCRYQVDRSS